MSDKFSSGTINSKETKTLSETVHDRESGPIVITALGFQVDDFSVLILID